MKTWKVILSKVILTALCAALCMTWAFAAAGSGSISLYLTDGNDLPVGGAEVMLFRAAEPDGTLTAQFAGAGVDPASLASGLDNAGNAKALAAHAAAHGISGTVKTTGSDGWTKYEGLTEGIYLLVCGAGQSVTFAPYLVYMPTVINGIADYEVESFPKAEDVPDPGPGTDPEPSPSVDPEPSVSPDPGTDPEPSPGTDPEPSVSPDPGNDPDQPDLPQTGVNVWPVYLLLGLGALFIAAGLVDLCVTGRKRDE